MLSNKGKIHFTLCGNTLRYTQKETKENRKGNVILTGFEGLCFVIKYRIEIACHK